jgi:hypothetical protein
MSEQRDHAWYREEAKRLCQKAVRADHAGLRESYLRLAQECERLAQTLEKRGAAASGRL